MKFLKNHLNLFLGILLGIIGVILVFLLQFKVIDESSSAFFILIGAGLTAIMNDYINKKTEERNEQKREADEKRKNERISKIISNILLNNYGISKGNIQRIEEDPVNLHLHLLKTGFLDLAINNISLDEDVGDKNIVEIMKISLNVDTINRDILRREEFIKKQIMDRDKITSEILESNPEILESNPEILESNPEIDKINKRLIKNSENIMKLIYNFAKVIHKKQIDESFDA